MSYVLYKHTFPNGKVYIGITSQKIQRRWRNGEGYRKNTLMHRAIQKYGWHNISHEIIFKDLTKEQAEQKEIELIKQYNSNNNKFGYNICAGGGVNIPTTETREKIGQASKGRTHSLETKIKLSKTLKGRIVKKESRLYGEKNYSYGRFGGKSAVSKSIIQLDDDENIINEWDSISEACRALGIKNQTINKVLHGGCKHAGGYRWKYKSITAARL